MAGRVIGIEDPEKKVFRYIALIGMCEYEDGEFRIEFSKYLKNYLINFTSPYTKLQLQEMLMYDSVYSFRLAELLHMEAYTPKNAPKRTSWQINYGIAELKFKLGVANAELSAVKNILNDSMIPDYEKALESSPEKLYNQFRDFKKRCIIPAVEEVNSKSDIHVEYELQKQGVGGKVKSIVFYITLKEEKSKQKAADIKEKVKDDIFDLDDFLDDVLSVIPDIKIKDARKIAETAGYDIELIKEKYNMTAGKKIDNIVGWMIEAIKNDYKSCERNRKKASETEEYYPYVDKDGKGYSYAELLKLSD